MSSSASPAIPSILEKILARRRVQVAEAQLRLPLKHLQKQLKLDPPQRRDFIAALRDARRPPVIAELKRASPSRGRLRKSFPVAELARAYAAAGASALSVLTEEDHFEGRLDYLQEAGAAAPLPILRKDFIFSPYQVWESAWAGADAILLIAAMLDPATLVQLAQTARRAGLATLCEVHSREELDRALRAKPDAIGVNHRDLRTFQVDLALGEEFASAMPAGTLAVAESGLRTAADLARMSAAGFHAFLIGEHFMQAPDPGAALADLLAHCRMPFLKICGITNLQDALHACAAGANAVGFVFAPSPRRIRVDAARALADNLPADVARVGVFAGAPTAEIRSIADACGLHAVQLHGPYLPSDGAALARHLPVWRALAMPQGAKTAAAWAPFVERFVLDSPARDGISGGTGTPFAWPLARDFAASLPTPRPQILVAGGLTPANVAAALRASAAEGADTASGVEARPGVKSPEAVTAFCRAARRVFRVLQS